MRIIFGTLDLPDGDAGAKLLDRYWDAGGWALRLSPGELTWLEDGSG